MTEFIPHQFEKLKAELLEVSGIKQIIPSDCKRLSANIYAKTHLQVSETTLKRVFGLACSEFKPSAFTVNAIAQYCGYSGWAAFVEIYNSNNEKLQPEATDTWADVKDRAKKITAFTLQTLQNRSGIPFAQTISRDFVNQHLDIFADESHTGTVLSAPAGYGKTIALCHWVANHERSTTNNDIVLYYKCNIAPVSMVVNHLNTCVLNLLGLPAECNLFESDFFENVKPQGKFYLVVDGLNECDYKRNEFQQLLNQLIDVAALYRNCSWFKIILSMRSATWLNNRHLLGNTTADWFLGFMGGHQQAINIPLFDAAEIARLATNINPYNTAQVADTHLHTLSHPLFFQYYYQLYQHNFSIEKVNKLSIYQLTTAHVVNQIYKGKHNDDKVILLRILVNNIEYIDGAYRVDKLKVHDWLKDYQLAYREMLSQGYLRNSNLTNGLGYDSYIEFDNENLLHFTLAEKLIADNLGQFNDDLIALIDKTPAAAHHKLATLKWCVYNMTISAKSNDLAWLNKAQLSVADKAEIISLLGQLLNSKKKIGPNDDLIMSEFADITCNSMFTYITGAEFMERDYEQSLQGLLNFNLPADQQLMVKMYLSFIAIIQLDIPKLERCINDLKVMPADAYSCMPVNPVNCLDAIYFYLKFGIIKKGSLVEITRFYFNPSLPDGCTGNPNINGIIPLMAICAGMLCQNDSKTVKFITALQKVYQVTNPSQNFLLKTWLANAYVNINKQKAMQLFNQLAVNFNQQSAGYTSFMKISYYALKVKIAGFNNLDEDTFTELRSLIRMCDANNHKMIKVTTIAHLLSKGAFTEAPKLAEQFYYDFVKTTRSNNCRTDSFLTKNS